MSMWGQVFAALYDRRMHSTETAGLRSHREALVGTASGDVLEIGGGTGANLPFYGEGVRTLIVTEPDKPMLRRLERRIGELAPQARFLRAPAEELPFPDASFDVAVSTLVLCTVDDQPLALRELRRVLRPGGRLLFIEHVRAQDPKLARLQDRIQPLHGWLACGCHCNRATLENISAAGFELAQVDRDTLKHAPSIVRPLVVGVAGPICDNAGRAPMTDG